MKPLKVFTLYAIFLLPIFYSFTTVYERLDPLLIMEDGPHFDHIGYCNFDMHVNGEAMVMQCLRPNDIVFDVGAHTGEWTLNALKREPHLTVYCFEPLPHLCHALRKLSNNHPIVVEEIALSDSAGSATFVYYPQSPGLSTLHQRPQIEKILKLEPVFLPVTLNTLDNFCNKQHIQSIDFIKIDTEGNELFIFHGAQELLQKGAIGMIQFEYGGCNLDSKTTLQQIYEYLVPYGYTLFRITPEGLIKISQWMEELETFHYCNYLAVKNP